MFPTTQFPTVCLAGARPDLPSDQEPGGGPRPPPPPPSQEPPHQGIRQRMKEKIQVGSVAFGASRIRIRNMIKICRNY